MKKTAVVSLAILMAFALFGCSGKTSEWPGMEISKIPGYGMFDTKVDSAIEDYIVIVKEFDTAYQNSDKITVSTFEVSQHGMTVAKEFSNYFEEIKNNPSYMSDYPDASHALLGLLKEVSTLTLKESEGALVVAQAGEQLKNEQWFEEMKATIDEAKEFLTSGEYYKGGA